MSPPQLQLRGLQSARLSRHYQLPLGRILVDMGVISAADLLRALAIHNQCQAPIHQVLLAEGFASARDILHAQAAQHAAISLMLDEAPPDADCALALDPLTCLEHGVIPWMRLGETLVLATCHPDRFEALRDLLPRDIGPVVMGIATVLYAAPWQVAIVHQLLAVAVWVLIIRARFHSQYPLAQSVRG